jgi:two-component system sensor histidine kinase NreB
LLNARLGIVDADSRSSAAMQDNAPGVYSIESMLSEALERERKRIAADIHDDIGHRLTLSLYQLGRTLDTMPPVDPARHGLFILRRMLSDCLDSVRAIPWSLGDGLAEGPDLADALELLLSEIPESEFLHVELIEAGDGTGLPARVTAAAFRITQEAVTNSLKYAKATRITVRVEANAREFILDIEDDGVGFSATAQREGRGGHGLAGMNQRAVAAGGTLYIHSSSNTGTRVRFVVSTEHGS